MRKHRANSDNLTNYYPAELLGFMVWGRYCTKKWPDGHPHTREKARRLRQRKK